MIADGTAADRTVVMASAQSAGRGRGTNRKWVSHYGNLYASFIYGASERRPTLSYAFAVAAAETLISFGVPARIRWPNDIMADGKKISGMLLEYCDNFLIVGIGINVKTNPRLEKYETAKAGDYAKGLTPNRVMGELVKNFEKWRTKDFREVRAKWTELSIEPNAEINYRRRPAVYCGLNEDGAMLLRIGDKYELVYGDEIFT
jgi:BirA family biotin operon repressor/biotin-[acetyl-CoA-carboxylase] ligase